MSESSLHSQSQQATSAAVDAGLRAYMLRVYNLMALAVAFTGIVSYLSISIPALAALALGPTRFVLFLGILGLGFMAPRLIFSQNSAMAQAAFWGYAALWGILIAPYFLIYTDTSIARSFFVTAGAFAGVSLFGYTTKRNLQGLGVFFSMASIGVLI
ncbi:MAG: Bax inhibitor-1 family protein, partial [Alphaproteobacteria bacterium]|nr:Bax inhibitor-1 family protein [Alphaproteobacteria bacterium]